MHALVCLLLYPAVAVDPPKPADAPKDLAKLEGVWKMTARETRGAALQVARAGAADLYTFVLVGDRYAFHTHGGTLTLDPAKHTVDFTITEGRYKGSTLLGRYDLTGDTLRLAVASSPAQGGERPAELKTGPETFHFLYTFERDKATKEAAAARLKEQTAALPAPGGFGTAPASATTQRMLRQIIDRLDRIEKRLDALEKNMTPPAKK
jgi:uncharacterized protein (TIGR03067 family)